MKIHTAVDALGNSVRLILTAISVLKFQPVALIVLTQHSP